MTTHTFTITIDEPAPAPQRKLASKLKPEQVCEYIKTELANGKLTGELDGIGAFSVTYNPQVDPAEV